MCRKNIIFLFCLSMLAYTQTNCLSLSTQQLPHLSAIPNAAYIGAALGFCANAFTRDYVKNNIVGTGAGALAYLTFEDTSRANTASFIAAYAVGATLAKGVRHYVHEGNKLSAGFLRYLARKALAFANYLSPDLVRRAQLEDAQLLVVRKPTS